MELEVQWQEHDLVGYPAIVLTWEDAMRGAPWDYIEKCEETLTDTKTSDTTSADRSSNSRQLQATIQAS